MADPKLIDRPYQEIVDDVLMSIIGGVVNEPHQFDVKVAEYPLSEPADPLRGVRSITGETSEGHRTFQPGVDFVFIAGTDTTSARVRWLMNGGAYPIHGTEFLVDYYRSASTSPLTDITVGSVTRTLSEAISREIAIVYQQINLAYLSAFIDTATGKSLDFVVAILGVIRKTADYAEGEVAFFRAASVSGSITINSGIKLMTADGGVTFETTSIRTLQSGQTRVNVPVRATVAGDAGIVDANAITQLLQPIAGIERVVNFDRTLRATANETDEELRLRAKAQLRGLNQCTIAALELAARSARVDDVEIRDPQWPQDSPDKWTAAGTVQVLIKGDPDRFEIVQGAIDEVRAAGVYVQVLARLVYVKPRLRVTVDPSVTAEGQLQIKRDLIDAMQTYIFSLSSGDSVVGADLKTTLAAALGVSPNQIDEAAQLRDMLVWLLDPDVSTERTARRELLVHDGQPASDDNIQAWEFEIQTAVDGNQALPVLDMTPDDIAIAE